MKKKIVGRKYAMLIASKRGAFEIDLSLKQIAPEEERIRVFFGHDIVIRFTDDPDYLQIYPNGEVVLKKQVYATGAYLSHTLCRKGLIPL